MYLWFQAHHALRAAACSETISSMNKSLCLQNPFCGFLDGALRDLDMVGLTPEITLCVCWCATSCWGVSACGGRERVATCFFEPRPQQRGAFKHVAEQPGLPKDHPPHQKAKKSLNQMIAFILELSSPELDDTMSKKKREGQASSEPLQAPQAPLRA